MYATYFSVDKFEVNKAYYVCGSLDESKGYEKLNPPYIVINDDGPTKGLKRKIYCDVASTLRASIFAAGAYVIASTF